MTVEDLGTPGASWLATRGFPITVVVEPLEPPALFEWFASFRETLGMTVVPLGPAAGPALLKALRHNELGGLVCDRDGVGLTRPGMGCRGV